MRVCLLRSANHHDGFDTWNSKYQPWNAMNHGPHRDVVGEWAAAARREGMRFGVTVHQARNWWWFQTAHDADKSGTYAGVSYDGRMTKAEGKGQWWDGLDPQMLYAAKHPKDALPDASYVKHFYDRTRDLIDQHDPDLLYFDNSLLPLGWAGMNIGAYFYNHNLKTRGKMEAILNGKQVPDKLAKALVADYERGLTSGIMPYAWQSETCIGEWHYQRRLFDEPGEFGGYLPPRDAIHWLVDTVSKNGTFILNLPGMPDGTIDSKEIAVLDQISAWLRINGEAIYDTRLRSKADRLAGLCQRRTQVVAVGERKRQVEMGRRQVGRQIHHLAKERNPLRSTRPFAFPFFQRPILWRDHLAPERWLCPFPSRLRISFSAAQESTPGSKDLPCISDRLQWLGAEVFRP